MVVGPLLFAAAAAWTVITAAAAGSSAGPTAGLILGAGVTLAISWALSSRRPTLVPAGIVGAAAALLVADADAAFRTGPLQGPLGYANASAAFFGQVGVAALLLAATASRRTLRLGGMFAGAATVPLILIAESWAVAILFPSLVLAALIVAHVRGVRAAVALCGAVFAVMLIATQAIGVASTSTGSGLADRLVRGTLSSQRVILWHEALEIVADEPLLGVGAGRFATTSPTASSDPDLRWAHHEFLQAGAESGLLGYTLTIALFLWGFAALWVTADGPAAALAAAGLAILGIHASLDYVLHFPAVALACAAVVGAAIGIGSGGLSVRRQVPLRHTVREPA